MESTGRVTIRSQKLEFASHNQLSLTASFFRHKVIHKVSWYSNTGKVQNAIDHILCRQSDCQCVLDTRVYRCAELEAPKPPPKSLPAPPVSTVAVPSDTAVVAPRVKRSVPPPLLLGKLL